MTIHHFSSEPKQETCFTWRYIILVNSKTRYRSNDYNEALDEYYHMVNSVISLVARQIPPVVVQLIDVVEGTIAEYRP